MDTSIEGAMRRAVLRNILLRTPVECVVNDESVAITRYILRDGRIVPPGFDGFDSIEQMPTERLWSLLEDLDRKSRMGRSPAVVVPQELIDRYPIPGVAPISAAHPVETTRLAP
jgi:hypothetical protein